jgi:predicted nucleotidyltransferase
MHDNTVFEAVKKRLVDAYDPLAIYIFGSYAWGNPTDESDLDLLIVVDSYKKDRFATMSEGYKALMDLDLSKDILVYNKDEFARFVADRTSLCYKVAHEGKQIYAKA